MLWLNNHRRLWRILVLLALLVALIGPWAFERIYVPAQYPCNAPFIRLEGVFCGIPQSGIAIANFLLQVMLSTITVLFTGSILLQDSIRELFFSLGAVLILLPFISSLLLVRERSSRSRQLSHIVVLGLTTACTLLFALSTRSTWASWGVWLYIGIATIALLLEILVFMMRNRQKPIDY